MFKHAYFLFTAQQPDRIGAVVDMHVKDAQLSKSKASICAS